MASQVRRAVITGAGALCAVGDDPASIWQAWRDGRSGVKPISLFDSSGLPVRIAGEMTGFDAKNFMEKKDRKQLRVMARTIQLAVASSQKALEDCQVDKSKLDKTRFGVIFGAGLIASELPELADAAHKSALPERGKIDLDVWGREGIPVIQPLWMLRYLPNMLACQVSILHDAQGPNNSITQDDVAGLLAVGETLRIMRRDHGDFFLVGGGDSRINPVSLSRQSLFFPMARRIEDPHLACRPFDAAREGLVLGEGCGVLVVEELEHAKSRGASIQAELVGFGAAFDVRLDGEGMARAIRIALDQAGAKSSDVDHVNACGYGTACEDILESHGIALAFKDRPTSVPVTTLKACTGHTGAASGTLELITAVQCLIRGEVPATLNHQATDPKCPVTVISGAARKMEKPLIVKTGFTREGQCAAVVLRRWNG